VIPSFQVSRPKLYEFQMSAVHVTCSTHPVLDGVMLVTEIRRSREESQQFGKKIGEPIPERRKE